jgi:HPt (histidine-containing phosphotransfer) domain-containing protein
MTKDDLKVCNLTYLFELAKGDTAFVKEMIEVFLAENPQQMQNLEKNIAEQNFAGIKQQTHKLRSSIPYMGLDSVVGDKVVEMEELAGKSSDIEQIKQDFDTVKSTFEEAYEELRSITI